MLAKMKIVWKSTALLKIEEFERAIRSANDKNVNPTDKTKVATKAIRDFYLKLALIANG